jgi:hypothetical protein
MQDRRVRAVDLAFERLQPVALLHAYGDRHVLRWHQVELEVLQRRRVLVGPHVRPHDASTLSAGIGLNAHVLLETRAQRLRRHIDDGARHVVLPAVIDTAQPAILVAAVHHRRAAMCAGVRQQADATFRVAKCDEVFAKKLDALRLPIGLEILRGKEWYPIEAHQLAHRRLRADAHERFIVFA